MTDTTYTREQMDYTRDHAEKLAAAINQLVTTVQRDCKRLLPGDHVNFALVLFGQTVDDPNAIPWSVLTGNVKEDDLLRILQAALENHIARDPNAICHEYVGDMGGAIKKKP